MKKLLVVLLVLGLAAPAMAQTNWHFYGSLRTHGGYYHVSEDYVGGPAQDGTIAVNDDFGVADQGTMLSLSGQSRLGFRGAVSDKLFGHVEFGLRETTGTTQAETTYVRLAYGQWNFGAGSLIFGKHYTPATFLGYSGMIGDIGDQGEANMLVAGLPYVGRQPQIRLSIAGLEVALIEQHTTQDDLDYDEIDRYLPRIEAAYVFRTPVIAIRPVLGYQTYKVNDLGPGGDDRNIESYLAGLGVSLTLGPAYVKMTGSYLKNAGNYGNSSFINPIARDATNIDDAETWQGTLVAGFAFSPAVRVEAGFGISYSKVDDDAIDLDQGFDFTGTAKQTGMVYYLQAPITIAKGFTLTPEIGQLSRGDVKLSDLSVTGAPALTTDDVDVAQGRMTYGMVSLRIDF